MRKTGKPPRARRGDGMLDRTRISQTTGWLAGIMTPPSSIVPLGHYSMGVHDVHKWARFLDEDSGEDWSPMTCSEGGSLTYRSEAQKLLAEGLHLV